MFEDNNNQSNLKMHKKQTLKINQILKILFFLNAHEGQPSSNQCCKAEKQHQRSFSHPKSVFYTLNQILKHVKAA